MPISAMPEHLNSKEEIEAAFPDDSQYGDSWFGRLYKRYNKFTKTWFAFSYRCTEWWAKTKKCPIILFAVRGNGKWRAEHLSGREDTWYGTKVWYGLKPMDNDWYLSRIQYHSRWHFAIQLTVWENIPFVFPMISFHWYPKASDVPAYGQPRPELDGKLWFAYWGHFDADLIHWLLTSGYLGRNWK